MCYSRNSQRNSTAAFAAAVLMLCALAGTGQAATSTSAWQMVVNDVETDDVVLIDHRADGLWADADVLRTAGVLLPARIKGDVRLDSLPDVTLEADTSTQRLIIRQRHHNRFAYSKPDAPRPLSRTRTALALSYDLTVVAGGDNRPTLAGYVDTHVYVGGAAVGMGAVFAPRRNGGTRAVRLDTALTLTDADHLFRASVGDVVGTGLRWSRSVRLGGIQMGNDFALRPDLITFPLPAIAGDVAVPSTIDVIADGGRTLAQANVQPGDYLLSGVPVATGHGTIGIVVSDASGRQSLRTIDLYGAPQLLAPGLMEIGGDMGAVRRGYGRRNADYRDFAASFTARRGLTRHLTVEAHGEVTEDLRLGGMGAVLGVGTFGVLSLDAAASRFNRPDAPQDGYQLGIAFERVARPVSFSLSARHVSGGYRDTAAVNGDAPPRSMVAGQIGIDLQSAGTFSLGYTQLFATRNGLVQIDQLSLLTASYSVNMGDGINLFAAGLGDFGRYRQHSLSLGLSMALGGGRSLLGAWDMRTGRDSGLVEYRDPALLPGDVGYRVAASGGAIGRLLAEIEYRAKPARFSAAIDRINRRTSTRLSARGAVLIVDDGIFFADSLAGGFAVVSTGAPGVMVFQEHRPVGRTRNDGRYLVTNLRLYQDNLLAVDPLDLPSDAQAKDIRMIVRPGEAGPVNATFDVTRSRATTVQLVDGDGTPLAPGGQVQLNAGATAAPLGYNGLVWLEGLTQDNRLIVQQADGQSCIAHVAVQSGPLPPRLGPLVCIPAG